MEILKKISLLEKLGKKDLEFMGILGKNDLKFMWI